MVSFAAARSGTIRTIDADSGRLLWAVRAGATPLDADAVRAFATGRLAHYKIPRYVLVVDDFPMTVTGKVRKVEMREKSLDMLRLSSAAQAENA